MEEINLKLDKIMEMMIKLDNKLIFIEKNYNFNFNLKNPDDVVIKIYELTEEFIKNCLEMCDINSDMNIIKKIYITDINNPSIRLTADKKKLEYWNEDKWNINDEYLSNVLITNIKNLYFITNVCEKYSIERIEQFLKNQAYLLKMSDQRYKDLFIKNIYRLYASL